MDKLREVFSPNRVALISGILLAAAAFVATLQTSLVAGSPGAEAVAKAAGVIASILTVWRLLEKFLDGAQNWDSLMVAGVPKVRGVSAPVQGNDDDDVLADEDAEVTGELTAEGMTMYGSEVDEKELTEIPQPRSVPPTLAEQEEDKPQ
jgi:hypothetical protein